MSDYEGRHIEAGEPIQSVAETFIDEKTQKEIARLKKKKEKLENFLDKNPDNVKNLESLKNIESKLKILESPANAETKEEKLPEEETRPKPIEADSSKEIKSAVAEEEEAADEIEKNEGDNSNNEPGENQTDTANPAEAEEPKPETAEPVVGENKPKKKRKILARGENTEVLEDEEEMTPEEDEANIQRVAEIKRKTRAAKSEAKKEPEAGQVPAEEGKADPRKQLEDFEAAKKAEKEARWRAANLDELNDEMSGMEKRRSELDKLIENFEEIAQTAGNDGSRAKAKDTAEAFFKERESLDNDIKSLKNIRVFKESNFPIKPPVKAGGQGKHMPPKHEVQKDTGIDQGMTLEEIESMREKITSKLLELTEGLSDQEVDELVESDEDYKKLKEFYDTLEGYWDKKREGKEKLTADDYEKLQDIQDELGEYLAKKSAEAKTKGKKPKLTSKVSPKGPGEPKGERTMETEPKGGGPRVETETREEEPITHVDEVAERRNRDRLETQSASVKHFEKAAGITFELDKKMQDDIEKNLMYEVHDQRANLVMNYINQHTSGEEKERLSQMDVGFALEALRKNKDYNDFEGEDQKLSVLLDAVADLKENKSLTSSESRRHILRILNERQEKIQDAAQSAKDRNDIAGWKEKQEEVKKLFELRNNLTEKTIGKNLTKRVIESGGISTEGEYVAKKMKAKAGEVEETYKKAYVTSDGKVEIDNIAILPGDELKPGEDPQTKRSEFREFIEKNAKDKDLDKLGINDPFTLACIKKSGYRIEKVKTSWADRNIWGQKDSVSLVHGDEVINLNALKDTAKAEQLEKIRDEARKSWGSEVESGARGEWQKAVNEAKEAVMANLIEKDSSAIEDHYTKIRQEIINKEVIGKVGRNEKSREDLAKLKEKFDKDPVKVQDALAKALEFKKGIKNTNLDDEENLGYINEALDSLGVDPISADKIKEFNSRSPLKFKDAAKSKKGWMSWLLELGFRPAPTKGKPKR